jgi:hypothetical protein
MAFGGEYIPKGFSRLAAALVADGDMDTVAGQRSRYSRSDTPGTAGH